jgi:hypothetical protein
VPSSLSRAASSMGAAMFARVHSSCSAKSLSAAGDDSEAVALTEFLRLKAVVEPLLQDPLELHPGTIRFGDATVVKLLQERLLSDPLTAAEVHHHLADHLVLSAGGRWHEESGVVFAPDTAKLLGEHLAPIRWLPFHLQHAHCWTDCVQLLCDLHFLQVLPHVRLPDTGLPRLLLPHVAARACVACVVGDQRESWCRASKPRRCRCPFLCPLPVSIALACRHGWALACWNNTSRIVQGSRALW